jgi:hypothetical protein
MKVYRKILGPVYDNKKDNWKILTNKESYAMVKKPTITETIRYNRLHWFGHLWEWKKNSQNILYTNLEATRLRGRPRNRRQDEVKEDGRLVGVKQWKERVYNREEWKTLLKTARNHCILHMPMKQMNVTTTVYAPCLGRGSYYHHKLHCAWYLAVSRRGWHSGYFLYSTLVSQ